MFKKFLLPVSICASVTLSNGAYALGLGAISVKSYLEDPLNVQIQLAPSSSDDLSTLRVQVASDEQFKQAGIQKQNFHKNLRFNVVSKGSNPHLVISSLTPIAEPFLHLLLDFNWNGGRILREYTALIDPPVYAAKTSSNTAAQPLAPSTANVYQTPTYQDTTTLSVNSSVESLPTAQTFPIDSGDAGLPEASSTYTPSETIAGAIDSTYTAVNTDAGSATIGPVVAGDSLSMIAKSIQDRYPELSIYQIMYVLFRDNPSAFIDNNINKLVKGAVLQASSITEMNSVSSAEGKALFYGHLSKLSIDSLATDVPTGSVSNESQAAENPTTPETKPEPEPSTISSNIDPEFKVGGSDIETSSATQGNDEEAKKQVSILKQKLTDAEAGLEAAKLENAELEERVSSLEKQLEDANQLIALESESTRELVEQLKNKEDEVAKVAAAAIEKTKTEVDTSTISEPSVEKPEPVVEEPVVQEPVIQEPVVQQPEPTIEEPVVKKEPADIKLPELPEKISFFDGIKQKILDNLIPVGGALAAFLALMGGIAMFRRKRSDTDFEDTISDLAGMDIDSQVDLSSESETASADFKTAETTITKESSFLTVYSDSEVVVHADEIDPIAEADVYIAYGRDEQGEEVLLEGVRKFPNRPDIKLSLLKLYMKRKDVNKFDGIAEQLFADGHNDNPDIWEKVVEMGSAISPDNPIYQGGASKVSTTSSLEGSNSSAEKSSAAPVAATAAATAAIAAAASEAKSILGDDDLLEDPKSPEVPTELGLDDLEDELGIDNEEISFDVSSNDDLMKDLEDQTLSQTEFVNLDETAALDVELGDIDIKAIDTDVVDDVVVDGDSEFIDDLDLELSNTDTLTEATILDDRTPEEVLEAAKEEPVSASFDSQQDVDVKADSDVKVDSDIVEFDDYDQNSVLDVELLDANASADSINVDSIIDDLSNDNDSEIIEAQVEASKNEVSKEDSIVDIASTPEPIVDGPGVDFDEPLSIQLEDVTLDVTPQAEIADPATQLELAKVFIELDDKSGAKEILDSLTDVSDKSIKKEVADLIKTLKK